MQSQAAVPAPGSATNRPLHRPPARSRSVGTVLGGTDRLGFVFPLLLVWYFFEFGRPPHPLGIPLVISALAFAAWLATRDKQLGRQGSWWFVLLAVALVSTALASNSYAAFWATKGMAVLFLAICLPLQSQITSVRRVRLWIYTVLLVCAYIGAWAATHGGYGPAGSDGGQDENYVSALMGMAIALAYFSLFAEQRRWVKGLLVASMVISVAAIGLANNPSRGAFLGLCAVGAYGISRSPKKLLGFGILALVGVALVAVAGPAFWAEIATTTDYHSGTGDIRLEIWKAGFRMWLGNPLFGVGPGNFKWVLEEYQSAAQFAKFGRSLGGSIIAHSSHVEMLAEVGGLGTLATGMLVWRTWAPLGAMRPSLRLSPQERRRRYSAEVLALGCYADAIRAAIIAILINGIFLSLFYYSHLWLLLAVGGAMPFVARRIGGLGLDSAVDRPTRWREARQTRQPEHGPPAAGRRNSSVTR